MRSALFATAAALVVALVALAPEEGASGPINRLLPGKKIFRGSIERIDATQVGQRDGYRSPEEQRSIIRDVAERAGVALGLEVVEEDVSGAKGAAERGLGGLLERAE